MDFFSDKAVLVTGGHGFLGAHLVHKLHEHGAYEVIAPTHKDLELLDWVEVLQFVMDAEPDIIFHLAAHVGGIHYNLSNPAKLIHDNSLMALNVVKAAYVCEAKLVAAGKLQRAYYDQYDMPGAHLVSANLYGPGDSFDPENSHVIPALIVKIQSAIDNDDSYITVWGTGQASRDMLYVSDAVEAYLTAAELIDNPEPVNIASGQESPVFYIVNKLVDIMGYEGEVIFDKSKPDGQKRRCFQINRMVELTGWFPEVSLDEGLSRVVDYYRREIHNQ
jgi:nucleoside-diphosphate-sugar epimerase